MHKPLVRFMDPQAYFLHATSKCSRGKIAENAREMPPESANSTKLLFVQTLR